MREPPSEATAAKRQDGARQSLNLYLIIGQYYVMERKSVREISSCARMKTWPDGTFEILASDRPVFREPGWERVDYWAPESGRPRRNDSGSAGGEQPPAETDAERAARRARVRVRDLARANEWSYFVTLTLDAARVDRYDMPAITKKLNRWLDNHVRRDGLRYVLVPERHKDGAIHFHGLFGGAISAVESGTWTRSGWKKPHRPRSEAERKRWEASPDEFHPVYNLPAWTLGFTTAIPLYGDRARAIEYVCKYIGKQGEKPGGRWYYSGGARSVCDCTRGGDARWRRSARRSRRPC